MQSAETRKPNDRDNGSQENWPVLNYSRAGERNWAEIGTQLVKACINRTKLGTSNQCHSYLNRLDKSMPPVELSAR